MLEDSRKKMMKLTAFTPRLPIGTKIRLCLDTLADNRRKRENADVDVVVQKKTRHEASFFRMFTPLDRVEVQQVCILIRMPSKDLPSQKLNCKKTSFTIKIYY
jgi:hypothetical protein